MTVLVQRAGSGATQPGSPLVTLAVLATLFFFNDAATTEIYTKEDALSLHDALPISQDIHPV